MKKILAIFLALIMIMSVALVACSNDRATTGGGEGGVEDDDNDFVSKKTDTSTDTDDESKKTNSGDWTALTNTTIYAMCKVNLRAEDSQKSTSVKQVEAMTALTAVAKSDDWYKVSYEGQELYIDANYVGSSLEEATFTDLAEADRFNVTIKAHGANEDPYSVYLGKLPTFDRSLEGTISVKKANTDVNPLIVIAKNGTGSWYKVSYNNEIYYLCITSKTKPYLNGIPTSGGNGEIVGG